jgi:hypothetical protein
VPFGWHFVLYFLFDVSEMNAKVKGLVKSNGPQRPIILNCEKFRLVFRKGSVVILGKITTNFRPKHQEQQQVVIRAALK